MAGSLAVVASEHPRGNAGAAAVRAQWQVRFARFFPNIDATATCLSLVPLSKYKRRSSPRGTWISSSSSAVSLQIIRDESSSDAILTVDLCGKILEEHYISKLNFSWPLMSCVSSFPPRGSRAIFVSYKDSASEIQKFALRFSTSHDVEAFIAALKENLKGSMETEPQKSDLGSEISSQSELMSTNRLIPRPFKEDPNNFIPLDTYAPEMPLSSKHETEQPLYTQQTLHNHSPTGSSCALPPSFTSILSGCFSETNQDPGQTAVDQEIDLKAQILKYMEDSAFQDMLAKVERVINELDGGWTL